MYKRRNPQFKEQDIKIYIYIWDDLLFNVAVERITNGYNDSVRLEITWLSWMMHLMDETGCMDVTVMHSRTKK